VSGQCPFGTQVTEFAAPRPVRQLLLAKPPGRAAAAVREVLLCEIMQFTRARPAHVSLKAFHAQILLQSARQPNAIATGKAGAFRTGCDENPRDERPSRVIRMEALREVCQFG